MPRQLLLEGPAIEPLLARVHEEHGTEVRILKAERVRVGGVGGFFAKVRFEVTVEVPDAGAEGGAPASAPAPGVNGLDALLAAAEDAERSSAPTLDHAEFWASLDLRLREELVEERPAAPAPAVLPVSLPNVPVMPAAPDVRDAPDVPAPAEGRVPVAVQAAPAPALAVQARAVQARAVQAQEVQAQEVQAQEVQARAVHQPPSPTHRVVAPEVVGLLQEAPAPWSPPAAPAGPPRPTGRHRADPPSADPPSADPPVPVAQVLPEPASPATGAPLPSRRSLRRQPPVPSQEPAPPAGTDLAERLEGLGVPRRWLHSLPSGHTDALRELATRLGERPATPRRAPHPGDHCVVVVLAEGACAVPTARTLALGLGLRAEEVVVLADGADGGSAGAAEPEGEGRAHVVDLARQRRRPLVVLLAVPSGADAGQRAAARALLTSLGVDQLWAVVDATRRTADVERWLSDVAPAGGVDAVSLVDLSATAAPGSGLDLQAPVVLLDGRPATPVAWVSMLAARLTEDDLAQHLGTR